MKVLFSITRYKDLFFRRQGGWLKEVTGLNKCTTDGFSIKGDFITDKDRLIWYDTDTLYLDCSKGGSNKYPIAYYKLFKVSEDGQPVILFETESVDWAIDLWEPIERYLPADPLLKNNPLKKFSTAELIKELKARKNKNNE